MRLTGRISGNLSPRTYNLPKPIALPLQPRHVQHSLCQTTMNHKHAQ